MLIKLTQRELIALGYDEPYFRDDPDTVRAIVSKTGKKPSPLNDRERLRLMDDVSQLATFGTDAADKRTATRLMKKTGQD